MVLAAFSASAAALALASPVASLAIFSFASYLVVASVRAF